jgi:hypothetical protein
MAAIEHLEADETSRIRAAQQRLGEDWKPKPRRVERTKSVMHLLLGGEE